MSFTTCLEMLFAVCLLFVALSCNEANASSSDWSIDLGSGKFKSNYSREKGIVFLSRPAGEWEYLATGTGRTGVAVLTHDSLVLQVNHEGAIDEHGWFKSAGRLRFDIDGDPLSNAARRGAFRMVHNLQKSLITITADTDEGLFSVEIRASVSKDSIRIDIYDERPNPGEIKLSLDCSWDGDVQTDNSIPGQIIASHSNGTNTDWHDINIAGGMMHDSQFADPLMDRCFGIGVNVVGGSVWDKQSAVIPSMRHRVIYIAASAEKGAETFKKSMTSRLHDNPKFISGHESWWKRYWHRVWFETEPDLKEFMTAYDMYRYFGACISGKNREFPVRFQIDILRSTLAFDPWLQMQINSIQAVEGYYPMMRNGDWDTLYPLLDHYERKRPLYSQLCYDYYGHDGVFIPYIQNLWGSAPYELGGPEVGAFRKRVGKWDILHHETHSYSKYSFEHGPSLIMLGLDSAQAKGDERMIRKLVLPYVKGFCTFFLKHYPRENGKIVFDPATSGETWSGVRNPASWIFLFKSMLPRAIQLAKQYDDRELADLSTELLSIIPNLATGKWILNSDGTSAVSPADETDDVFLPAEIMDRKTPINVENPELYGVWPYRVLGPGKPDFDRTQRTFDNRHWKLNGDGWNLDCIWSACLDMTDYTVNNYKSWQFPNTVRCPGGFSFETAPTRPEEPSLPLYPSMQGMGAGVCPLYEMVIRETDDGIRILPAWPKDKSIKMSLYSPKAGRVEIDYTPGRQPKVKTERQVHILIW